jgi:serine/threonine protein kinase
MQAMGMLTGRTLGDYQLGAPLGDDGFGPIYEALHLHLNRSFALRVLSERFTFASSFEEHFWRVGQVLAALEHPNLLNLDDYSMQDAYAYLVTPFVEGLTLEDWLRQQQGQPAGPAQVLRLFSQVLAAFNYAHQAGVTHLGLTPRHILVEPNGHLLVANFGLPYLAEQLWIAWNGSRSFGDPRYLAPEQFPGRSPAGVRSDIHALGVILYRMLTGVLPYTGSPRAILAAKLEEPPALRARAPGLPPALESVVARALMPEAEDRWPDVASFGGAFFLALEHSGLPIPQRLLAGPGDHPNTPPGGQASRLLAAPQASPLDEPAGPPGDTVLPMLPGDYSAPAGRGQAPPSAAPPPPGRSRPRPEMEPPPLRRPSGPSPADPAPATVVAWSSAGRGRAVPPPPPPAWNQGALPRAGSYITTDLGPGKVRRTISIVVRIILLLLTLGALAGAIFYGYQRWQQIQPAATPTFILPASPTLSSSPTKPATDAVIRGARV